MPKRPNVFHDMAARRRRQRELDEMRAMPGVAGEQNRIIWGKTDAEYERIVEAEFEADRAAAPWAFRAKFTPRGKKKGKA